MQPAWRLMRLCANAMQHSAPEGGTDTAILANRFANAAAVYAGTMEEARKMSVSCRNLALYLAVNTCTQRRCLGQPGCAVAPTSQAYGMRNVFCVSRAHLWD